MVGEVSKEITMIATGFVALATAMLEDARKAVSPGLNSVGTFQWKERDEGPCEFVIDDYSPEPCGRPLCEAMYCLDGTEQGEVICYQNYEGRNDSRWASGVVLTPRGLKRLFAWATTRARREYEGTLEVLSDEELERRLASIE